MPGGDEGASPDVARVPLQEGRETKPEFEGYARLQEGVDSGAAAAVIPERWLGGRRVSPSQ
eukprot:12504455-Alexandrium_andersonii.AAC.1